MGQEGLRQTTPLDTHVIGYSLYQDIEKDTLLNMDIATTIYRAPCHKPQSTVPPLGGSQQTLLLAGSLPKMHTGKLSVALTSPHQEIELTLQPSDGPGGFLSLGPLPDPLCSPCA